MVSRVVLRDEMSQIHVNLISACNQKSVLGNLRSSDVQGPVPCLIDVEFGKKLESACRDLEDL